MKKRKKSLSRPAAHQYDEFEKRLRLYDKYILSGMRLLDKAENVLLEDYERYKSANNREMLEHSLSSLATFQLMLGRNPKAERYLREREVTFPASIEAKLQTASYFGRHLRNPKAALQKLRQVRLPKTPAKGDYDVFYNALNLKGTMLLWMEQVKGAKEVMADLVEFTDRYLNQILFFFDLSFVEVMITRRLALKHCQAYLKTLSRRKQVIHDQKKTLELLRTVNQLLRA